MNDGGDELTPVEYFHVVFTVPEQDSAPGLRQSARRFITFCSAPPRKRCQPFARDPKHLGAGIGFFAVLHTWGQNLLHHPHVHCAAPGGGLRRRSPKLGSIAGGAFSSRTRAFATVPALCFWNTWEAAFQDGGDRTVRGVRDLDTPGAWSAIPPSGQVEGVVDANHRLAAPAGAGRSGPRTRTGQPCRTNGCCRWTTAASPFNGRTTGISTSIRRG